MPRGAQSLYPQVAFASWTMVRVLIIFGAAVSLVSHSNVFVEAQYFGYGSLSWRLLVVSVVAVVSVRQFDIGQEVDIGYFS